MPSALKMTTPARSFFSPPRNSWMTFFAASILVSPLKSRFVIDDETSSAMTMSMPSAGTSNAACTSDGAASAVTSTVAATTRSGSRSQRRRTRQLGRAGGRSASDENSMLAGRARSRLNSSTAATRTIASSAKAHGDSKLMSRPRRRALIAAAARRSRIRPRSRHAGPPRAPHAPRSARARGTASRRGSGPRRPRGGSRRSRRPARAPGRRDAEALDGVAAQARGEALVVLRGPSLLREPERRELVQRAEGALCGRQTLRGDADAPAPQEEPERERDDPGERRRRDDPDRDARQPPPDGLGHTELRLERLDVRGVLARGDDARDRDRDVRGPRRAGGAVGSEPGDVDGREHEVADAPRGDDVPV